MGELDPKRVLKCYGYRFGDKPLMIVARSGKQPLSRLVEQGDLGPLERLKLVRHQDHFVTVSKARLSGWTALRNGKGYTIPSFPEPTNCSRRRASPEHTDRRTRFSGTFRLRADQCMAPFRER